MSAGQRRWLPAAVILLALTAAGAGIARMRAARSIPDLPTVPVRKGEFLVLVRTRGELSARRSIELHAPKDIPDLQIVSLAPPGSEVSPGQVVVRFDPSKARQQLSERAASLRQAQGSLDQAVAQAKANYDSSDLFHPPVHFLTVESCL